jgi:hypothetical protein
MGTAKWTVKIRMALMIASLCAPSLAGAEVLKSSSRTFTQDFMLENCTFSSIGRNPYFILEPGYQTTFEGIEAREAVINVITVLNKTRRVGGVETRIVEERETHDSELVEVSRNYFAICTETNSVFYFGEDVDLYEGGLIVAHSGSWLAGSNGARAGLIMPGIILLGSRYAQEIAPGIAMDQAETVGMDETVVTPAGTFEKCVKSAETTALEPNALEFKFYAAGIGLVQDDTLRLARYVFVK